MLKVVKPKINSFIKCRMKDDTLYHRKDIDSIQLGANLLTFSFDQRTLPSHVISNDPFLQEQTSLESKRIKSDHENPVTIDWPLKSLLIKVCCKKRNIPSFRVVWAHKHK